MDLRSPQAGYLLLKVCADNPGFASAVLSAVTEAIVEVTANDTEKEKASQAREILQRIAAAAVHAELLKTKEAEAGSLGESGRLRN
ncbi:hypothetical protein KUL72_06430 [Bradyrhizobium arachidis]|uniref:hypothetical protein n=1 Tax=Bradyrhizobium arachidis TaxID=858423 RepID=UPI002161A6E3|nr:hypothetical protein [Bradyrhizobium arachidis]UVO38019.1 hypothetical protein KUL72_06430 [Bradyrhizobium arachidis]